MSTSSEFLTKLDSVLNNPASIQRASLQYLRDIRAGNIDVLDPSNPFVFLLEVAAHQTAAGVLRNEVNTRKQYPRASQEEQELYLHMSDKDYLDRFALPAKTKLSLLFSKNELINRMVLDPARGFK